MPLLLSKNDSEKILMHSGEPGPNNLVSLLFVSVIVVFKLMNSFFRGCKSKTLKLVCLSDEGGNGNQLQHH